MVDKPAEKFDRQLFTLKLSEFSRLMQMKSLSSDNAARQGQENPYFPDIWSRSSGQSVLPRVVEGQLALLNEWLEGVDRRCREVWQVQGEEITPEFVRDVLVPEAVRLIDTREATVRSNREQAAFYGEDSHQAQHLLEIEVNRLKAAVSNRYEIEARTLEYKKAHKPKPELPLGPIRPLHTAHTVTQAPAPPKEVGGFGLASYRPEPTQIPPDFPAYYPNELKPRTAVIRSEAAASFPHQTQMLNLCRHFVSEMKPFLSDAVKAGTMKAHEALGETVMMGLLHSWLVYNCKYDNDRYVLEQEVRKSDEWREFEKAIEEAQHLRTGTKHAELPHAVSIKGSEKDAESSAKTAQSPESKPADKYHKSLTDREQKIWEVIQPGLKATPPLRGMTYCREVDAAKISPPRKGIWADGPRTYVAAYKSNDKRLVHWIQNEKSKIRRKAELAGNTDTRAKLASE